MKAIGLTRYLPTNDPQSLLDIEVSKPVPDGRDLLVRVEAISVNPVDTKIRRSKGSDITEPSPRVLGWDAAGIVEAVGPIVTLFKPGDEVFYAGDITRPGSNAEYQLVDEQIVGHKPQTLSFAEAAALPLTTITAWETFFDRFRIDQKGANQRESILIIGGAGGVGSIGIQLAKLAGLTVIATASRPETVKWCHEMGADYLIDHHQNLRSQLEKFAIRELDYITNFNNTDAYWNAMADLIKPQGAICSIVENETPINLGLLKSKSATFVWEFMFTRSMYQTSDMLAQHTLLNEVADLVDAGKLRTTLTKTLSPINATNLRAAHAQLESGRVIGKLVLSGWN